MAKLEDLVYAFRNLSDGEKAAVLGAVGATGGAGIGAAVGGLKGAGIGAGVGGALGAAGSMAVPDVGNLEAGAHGVKRALSGLTGKAIVGSAAGGALYAGHKGTRQAVNGAVLKALALFTNRGKAPMPSLSGDIKRWRGW